MIEQAAPSEISDGLIGGDIEREPFGRASAYDMVLAADTFVYLGDLAEVMKNTARLLKPAGMLLFTAEKDEGRGFSLGPKRRWRHSASYLRVEAERQGFAVA